MAEEAQQDAAFLVIGNEILSGRTKESNLNVLADRLRERGVRLAEARVVRDVAAEIVEAVNDLRARRALVFTSGGIGPTHDDITTECVAAAFGVPVVRSAEAEGKMREQYASTGREATDARLRMADVPQGASLVYCPGIPAPGYLMGNVYVFAGVPGIFAGMLEAALDDIAQGVVLESRSVFVAVGESTVADQLAEVQGRHPNLELGSYPKERAGGYVVELVFTGADLEEVGEAVGEFTALLAKMDIEWETA